jgi:ABC-type lipoprotein export system ATPase subunit
MTIIMVTHSPECAAHARRRMSLSDGRLISDRAVLVTTNSTATIQASAELRLPEQ